MLKDSFELATISCVSPWSPYVVSRARRELVPERGNSNDREVVYALILSFIGLLGSAFASRTIFTFLSDDMKERDIQDRYEVRGCGACSSGITKCK